MRPGAYKRTSHHLDITDDKDVGGNKDEYNGSGDGDNAGLK